jgi:hypothetical protein
MDRDDLGPIDVDLTEAGVDLGPDPMKALR